MSTMKAIEFTFKKGDPKVVQALKPVPQEDEVLVRVVSSAIDTALDSVLQKTMTGSFIHAKTTPLYLGWHYSGVVQEVGSDVKDLSSGQEVWGHLQYAPSTTQGSFAEYVTVKETECAVKPHNVPHSVAAATSTEALTALQALRDLGGLEGGKSVLIVGAGGGVGSAAVQIAKALGAHVTAVVSKKDVERVKKLGADKVMDRSVQDPLKTSDRFDVIFDTPNVLKTRSCLKLLNKGGTHVITIPSMSFLFGMMLTAFSSKQVKFVEVNSKREDLEYLGKLLANGDLDTSIESTFAVSDMEAAIQHHATKKGHGRVVIDVEGGFQGGILD